MKRRVLMTVGLVVWTFFGFMLAQAIGLAVVAVLEWAGVPLRSVDRTLFNTIANIVIYSLSLVIVIGMPLWIKKRPTTLQELGLQRLPKWLDTIWPLAGGATYIILTVLVMAGAMALFPGGDYNQAQETGFSYLTSRLEYILAFVSLVIVAPVAEEIIFRGYLLGKLRKYAADWIAVLLTAALFALAHFQLNVSLDTFALGVVLCYLRIFSGSIWASIFLHMLKNGVAYYFLFVNPAFL